MGLRVKLIIALTLVALLGVGAALVAADRFLVSAERDAATERLSAAVDAFRALDAERMARRSAEARVVANEPRLKGVVRTSDIDQGTLVDIAEEMHEAWRADLFALVDRSGQVLADTSVAKLDTDLSSAPGVAEAVRTGEGHALWRLKGNLYRVVVLPLRFGVELSGLLVTGFQLGDDGAQMARSRTGENVALLLDRTVIGSAFPPRFSRDDLAPLGSSPDGPSELELSGERFLTLKVAHPGVNDPGARVVFARSLDDALARHGVVRQTLVSIGGLAVLGAFAIALTLGRSFTRRIEDLSIATTQLARGDVNAHVDVRGEDEVARLGENFNAMARDLASSRAALAKKERAEQELQIAQRIQSALLPTELQLPAFSLSARMKPAEVIGGDFYDVLPGRGHSFWLCIGDVTSHGLTPGLIMMMVQSAITAIHAATPDAGPREVLAQLNRVLYANIRERLKDDNHMTLTLLQYEGDGHFIYAGAHLDILIRRVNGKIDRYETPGVWVGLVPEILDMLEENTVHLDTGDLMLLYTDGLTEARSSRGMMFDISGVEQVLRAERGGPAAVCDRLFESVLAHVERQEDDMTVLAVQRVA